MTIAVFTANKNLTYENVKTFVMSANNNAVYIKSTDGKTRAIFNKDKVCGVINRDHLLKNDLPNHYDPKFSIIFNNGAAIDINADYYDFNVYTNTVTFYIGCEDDNKSYVKTVGIFNVDNLIGFEKIIRKEDKDGSAK